MLKLPPRKLKPGFVLWSFYSSQVDLHLFKFTIWSCMEYCCPVWAVAPDCYLEMFDKLQKQICRAVAPSLSTFLELLGHCQNVISLSLFYRYYFDRCSPELVQLAPVPYSWGSSTCYSHKLHDFSVTIPRCYKDVYISNFFPHTARLEFSAHRINKKIFFELWSKWL